MTTLYHKGHARLQFFLKCSKTGANALAGELKYYVNGFDVEFDRTAGGTGAGETLNAVGYPESHPHTLALGGPESGVWDLEGLRVTYHFEDQEPYSVRLGAVTLRDDEDLNLLYDRPLPVMDV